MYAVGRSPQEDLPTLPGVDQGLLTFVDTYDGYMPATIVPTTFVLKCANVLPSLRKDGLMRHRHTSTVVDRSNNRVGELIHAHSVWMDSAKFMEKMMETSVSFGDFIKVVLPEADTDRGESRRQGVRDDLWFAKKKYVDSQFDGTLFGAFQAVDSYDKWEAGRAGKSGVDRQLEGFLGTASGRKSSALSEAARNYVSERLGIPCLI